MPVEGIEEFRRAALSLRGADKTVTAEVAKNMRQAAKPVVAQIRTEVRSSKGQSPKGASARERQLHALRRVRGKGEGGALTERQVRSANKRLERLSSLREAIAAASGSSVSVTDKKTALAFRVRASQLPPSQRKLPRRWNSEKGWRHPVFGNREVWVPQVGHPYFHKVIRARQGEITGAVVAAVKEAAEKITHIEGLA
jgi:hypothetical protein